MSNIVVVIPPSNEGVNMNIGLNKNNNNIQNELFQDQKFIESIHTFWFGQESTWSSKYSLKPRMWFSRKIKLDKIIKNQYEPLLLEVSESYKTKEKNGIFERWINNQRGRMALVVLLDQFPRNIYRGTSEMFDYDDIALYVANSIINSKDYDYKEIYSPAERIFLYLTIQHCEDENLIQLAYDRLSKLSESITNPEQKNHYNKIVKSAKDHLDAFQRFKRYPHRNLLLKRTSTTEEMDYLKSSNYAFVKSVVPRENTDENSKQLDNENKSTPLTSENQVRNKSQKKKRVIYNSPLHIGDRPKLKLLFLHSFRQNGSILKRATKKLLGYIGDIATIHYANAPLSYNPSGEMRDALINAFGNLPETSHQRQWWNASKDNKVYHHLEASIHYISQLSKTEGPFDGIIGFSQGAALVGILAALQQHQSLSFKFDFAILISGFPSRADIHEPLMKADSIDIPSLSILGKNDDLVDNDRTKALSELFKQRKLLEHQGGHFSPNQWPNKEIREFLVGQGNLIEKGQSMNQTFPSIEDIKNETLIELSTFQEIIELSLKHFNSTTPQYQEQVPIEQEVITLYGLSSTSRKLISSIESFKDILSYPPKLIRESITSELKPISKIFKENPSVSFSEKNYTDLLCLIWSNRIQFKQHEFIETPLFYNLWLELYLLNPTFVIQNLEYFPIFGSWRDICTLVYIASKLTDLNEIQLESIKTLRKTAVEMFSIQLKKDYNLIYGSSTEQGTENSDSHENTNQSSFVPEWPSNCALESPRLGGGRKGYSSLFAKELARFMFPITLPTDVSDEILRKKKGICYEKYRKILASLSNLLRNMSPLANDNSVLKLERELFRKGGATSLSEEQRQKLLNQPPSTYVTNPTEEPVFPAPLDELDPLLEFMKNDSPLPSDGSPMQFTRGTILSDGRLDLCKQVVGPEGIKPLLVSMKKHTQVKRLLLGNNIVGNGGAIEIADYIKNNQESYIDTWYIAGNSFTEEGIKHITLALEDDKKVKALWLKRNPLLIEGTKHISRLLEKNNYLQTLDLLNCGVMDEGILHLFNALQSNSTLKNLYVCTNGLTPKSAQYISNHLSSGKNNIESLYMSCNMFGDIGAIELAKGLALDKSIIRFGLASNCIGPKGTKALVDSILLHPTIKYLDLGFVKATFQVGGLNNVLGDEGAQEIARLIKANTGIRAIDLTHNGISQKGMRILYDALTTNTNLTVLSLIQFTMVHNELSKEGIISLLNANRLRWAQNSLESKDELSWKQIGDKLAEDIVIPQHTAEILSVYRTK